jgi:hypothetical protein
MLQVTEPKALRKLKSSLEEPRFAQVKGFMLALLEYEGVPAERTTVAGETVETIKYVHITSQVPYDCRSLLLLPRVKENANMVAILREVGELLDAHDLNAAKAVVKRVLEVPPAVMTMPTKGGR